MQEASIKLNPLGPHYYAELPREHRTGLPDIVEDAMNNLTVHPFNPKTHGGKYVPRKAYISLHVKVGTFKWDDEYEGQGRPDYEIELLDPDEGAWYNRTKVEEWKF